MGLFGPIQTVNETCSCGATFKAQGPLSVLGADEWRRSHYSCPARNRRQKRVEAPRSAEQAATDHPDAAGRSEGDGEGRG